VSKNDVILSLCSNAWDDGYQAGVNTFAAVLSGWLQAEGETLSKEKALKGLDVALKSVLPKGNGSDGSVLGGGQSRPEPETRQE